MSRNICSALVKNGILASIMQRLNLYSKGTVDSDTYEERKDSIVERVRDPSSCQGRFKGHDKRLTYINLVMWMKQKKTRLACQEVDSNKH
jgi:hypothetical protein